jgi:CheY-like chemotaxis protein
MARRGPIIMIEDDSDDRELFEEAFQQIGVDNERHYFNSSDEVINYLRNTKDKPMMILSDLHLPGSSGLDLKATIEADPQLRQKSIPFIFFTTSASQKVIDSSYIDHVIQGFFKKPDTMEAVKKLFSAILHYWEMCEHPSTQ